MIYREFVRLSSLITLAAITQMAPAQVKNADRQIIATLEQGEALVPGKACFELSPATNSTNFITQKDEKFYVYDQGKRSGPYEQNSPELIKECSVGQEPPCSKFETRECFKEEPFNKFVSYADGGQVITLKGKKYGPYFSIMQLAVTCDESQFMAMVMVTETQIQAVHSNGAYIRLKGTPYWVLISPDGSQGLAACNPDMDPETFDPNNFNPEVVTRYEVVDLQQKVYGPYNMEKQPFENFWFSKTGGAHWFLKQDDQIFCDGKVIRKVDPRVNICDLWFSEDGKRLAVADYGLDGFAESDDTWRMIQPMQIITYKENDKTWIKWITLENDRELVVYRKVL